MTAPMRMKAFLLALLPSQNNLEAHALYFIENAAPGEFNLYVTDKSGGVIRHAQLSGESTYQTWLSLGGVGSKQDFLDSLKSNGTNVQFGAGDLINTDYLTSKGSGLVANSTGLLGNNYNFSGMVFDPTIVSKGKGSFYREGFAYYLYSDEFIAVDTDRVYRLTCDIMQDSVAGDFTAFTNDQRHRTYLGLTCYDIDGLLIKSSNIMFVPDTHTVLTAPLTPGDTQINVADATNWKNDDTVSKFFRSLSIWEYKNSFGYKYDYYTTYHQSDLWDAGGIAGNIITLSTPIAAFMGNPDHPNGTWPVGTKISNGASGGTYKYSLMSGVIMPKTDAWFRVGGFIGGTDKSGSNHSNNFPPATSSVKLFGILNHSNREDAVAGFPSTTNAKIRISGFSIQQLEQAAVLADGNLRVLRSTSDHSSLDWAFLGSNPQEIEELV